MGLYERSLKTRVRIKGSNRKALDAIYALSQEMGTEILESAEFFITREVYELMVTRGYYDAKPRSGNDRRVGDRRKGPRRG